MQISLADRNGGRSSANRAWPESPITVVEVPEYFQRKTAVMRLLGILLLIVFLPLMLVCLALVRLTSRGPAIYHQMRYGKDQRPFKLYKIRTMYAGCENVSGPMLCQPGDSRVTPVGRVLRFLHLDELPQLINVARGEMCLVGPRPERPEIIERHKLKEVVPGFEERTKVLPGVTGLAQINLPADLTAESVIPKVQLDLGYIETATAALDFRILLCTALRMSGVRHGRAVRLLGLERNVHLADSRATPAGRTRTPERISAPHRRPVGYSSSAPPARKSAQLAVAAADSSLGLATNWEETTDARDGGRPHNPR